MKNKNPNFFIPKQIVFFLYILFLFPFVNARADIFGPKNYEDCVLINLKDAKTDLAVRTVYNICENKFPKASKKKFPKLDLEGRATLICTISSSSRGMRFELNIKARQFNGGDKKGKITSITKSKIMAEINSDYFLLDINTGMLDLENGGRHVLTAECEEEMK